MTEYLYRAFGTVDWVPDKRMLGGELIPEASIWVDAIPILRRTPKGAWVKHHLTGRELWVSTEPGRKRYACLTKEEAMTSLRERNRWRLIHLRRQTREANAIKNELWAKKPGRVQHLRNGMFASIEGPKS